MGLCLHLQLRIRPCAYTHVHVTAAFKCDAYITTGPLIPTHRITFPLPIVSGFLILVRNNYIRLYIHDLLRAQALLYIYINTLNILALVYFNSLKSTKL